MTYGQQLLTHRKCLGLTQVEVAELLDLGLSTYRAWETDDPKRVPLLVAQEGALARLMNTELIRNATPITVKSNERK
jgi:transcriptional regulator with XRE-family HTH domain